MLTEDLIKKIRGQINLLYQQSQSIDQRNIQIKSDRFKYRDFFNHRLFRSDSILLTDYVLETDTNFKELLRLSTNSNTQIAQRGEQLTDQITALTQAIRANEVAIKEHFHTGASNKRRFAKYKKTANHFMADSHQLHKKLAEYHEFERRLNEMIYERQAQLKEVNAKKADKIQQEILALHQRLGKCRRAITGVEEQIQFADSKNRF
jgi:primosomal replication protein N''